MSYKGFLIRFAIPFLLGGVMGLGLTLAGAPLWIVIVACFVVGFCYGSAIPNVY